MRIEIALAVLLGVVGCSEDPSATTSRSVWWVPVVAWNDSSLDNRVLGLLADKGIEFIHVGSRGMRVRVPYERHRQAIDLLRGASFAEHLRIHAVLAGPRSGANLPLLGPESGDSGWTELLSFTLAEVAPSRLQDALNARGVECGAVSFAWDLKVAHLYVPPGADALARTALKEASLEGAIKFK